MPLSRKESHDQYQKELAIGCVQKGCTGCLYCVAVIPVKLAATGAGVAVKYARIGGGIVAQVAASAAITGFEAVADQYGNVVEHLGEVRGITPDVDACGEWDTDYRPNRWGVTSKQRGNE